MHFPYHFVNLDESQELRRRQLLDGYGHFAQISVLLLPLIYQLGLGTRLIVGTVVRRFKQPSNSLPSASIPRLRWLLDEVPIHGYGTLQHWLLAAIWALWLLILATRDTGDDYLHVTKRFGIIAASQLPLHYLLAAKAWNPIQYLTRMSHEELNPYHRLLGRIIITFMAIHASMYLNFYVQKGLLLKRIQDRDVILGLTAITTALTIFTTALSKIRNWNYRLFFYLHVTLSISLLPLLYLHVPHLRAYILEATTIYILLIAQRNTNQASANATIKTIPHTNLLSITIPLSNPLSTRSYKPGQHIYIGFPSLPQKLRINPFSIANPDPHTDKSIHLIARTLNGTTALLASLASHPLLSKDPASHPQPIPLLIEGPYGSAKYFPDLATTYDRILLVAGGVGATFTLPFYRALLHRDWKGERTPPTRFVWIVKQEADARWGVEQVRKQVEGELPREFEVYVTGKNAGSAESISGFKDGSIELQEREKLLDATAGGEGEVVAKEHVREGRPDLRGIVDELFSHDRNERVAVLVCGPMGMGAAARKEVGRWVRKGREVFWHSEEFGW